MLLVLRVLVFVLGAALVGGTMLSAIHTFVLPRASRTKLSSLVFRSVRRVFEMRVRWARSYAEQDRIMALFAPIALLMLPPTWLLLCGVGYTGMFWGLGVRPVGEAIKVSGSSMLTLGFATVNGSARAILAFSEAMVGLILVALLIAYLPVMYGAFQRREAVVNLLEVRAGSPPSAVEMIARYQRIGELERIGELWPVWENWFVDVEESHTSLAALSFFRSPQPEHSWVTAAGAVLDAAAIMNAAVDMPHDARADLLIRAGYLALQRIASFFAIPYNPAPSRGDPISILREEFDAACDQLAAGGVPLHADREAAWADFAGWRVNYDTVLLALANLTMAPYAPWSSDRGLRVRLPLIGAARLGEPSRRWTDG
jgi:hypothetical protein